MSADASGREGGWVSEEQRVGVRKGREWKGWRTRKNGNKQPRFCQERMD